MTVAARKVDHNVIGNKPNRSGKVSGKRTKAAVVK
jgi:hypothetical protein